MTGGRLFLYSHSSWRDGTSSTWEKQSKTGLKGSCAVKLQDDRYTNSTESTMRASRMLYVYFGRFSQISNSSPPVTWTKQWALDIRNTGRSTLNITSWFNPKTSFRVTFRHTSSETGAHQDEAQRRLHHLGRNGICDAYRFGTWFLYSFTTLKRYLLSKFMW